MDNRRDIDRGIAGVLRQYVPPHLRGPLSEAGRVGYQVLDNIIGFDDDYDTTGELLGRALREDPAGTLADIAGGMYEGVKSAVTQPVETMQDMADEFASAYMRVLTPLPEDATREQIGQRTADLALLGSVVPAGQAVKTADSAIDAAQRAQAERFVEKYTPTFAGEPFATNELGETQFYHPSVDEAFDMMASPNPAQAALSPILQKAEADLAGGASREDVAAKYGVLSIPRRTFTGGEYGDRVVAAVTPQGMAKLRPERASNYGVQFVDDPELKSGQAFFQSVPGEDPVIAQSPRTPAAEREAVQRHEMTHADLDFGDVPHEEVGSSPSFAYESRLEALEELNERIKAASTPEERERLIKLRDELQDATSYELYQRNPGEMLARLAEGDPTTVRALSLTEVLNPYIRPDGIKGTRAGLPIRALEALSQGLLSERSGILSVPAAKAAKAMGIPVNPRAFYDTYARIPTDLDRAVYPDQTIPF